MNDDRKFKERAELMKELFLARIPSDVIAKIAGVSESTVSNDRDRIAKLYGIEVPNAASSALEREERFKLLLKAFLYARFETHNRKDPLYQASRLIIDFKRLENHIYTIEDLFENLENPRFTSEDPIDKNYQQLLEDCLSANVYNSMEDYLSHRFSLKKYDFLRDFYHSIHTGLIPLEEIDNEETLIELSTKFCCDRDRNSINTLTIDNSKALVESILPMLNENQIIVIKCYYGLGVEKKTLSAIGDELGLTKERIRQIREKALSIIRNELNEKKYLIHSTARYNHLEEQYAKLDEKYRNYCDKTDKEILELNQDILRLKGVYEKQGEGYNLNDYPIRVQILIQPIKDAGFSIRVTNSLCCYYEYILDIIEDWDNLLKCRNFGKKSLGEVIDYLDDCDIDRNELKMEEKVLARQIIKRLKASQT